MAVIKINKENFASEVLNSDKTVLLGKVGKINVDEQPELAAQFGVASIPMLAVMKNGKLVNYAVGARPKAQIEAML